MQLNSPDSEQNDEQFVDKQFATFLSLKRNFEKASEQSSFDGWFHDLNDVHRGAKGAFSIHIKNIL